MNGRWRLGLAFALAALLPACTSLSGVQRARVDQVTEAARAATVTCERSDACATPSPLRNSRARACSDSAASGAGRTDRFCECSTAQRP